MYFQWNPGFSRKKFSMRKIIILTAVIFITPSLFSQKGRNDFMQEIRVRADNDNYAFTFTDGYYTNGLFLQYSKPAKWKTSDKLVKIITDYTLGQMIFNSENYNDRSFSSIDRPLSGYLFLQKGYKFFYKKGHVLQTDFTLGGTGKASYAKEVQIWYHKLTGLPKVTGWPLQLNGETTMNLSAQYNYNLLGIKNQRSNLEIMGIATGNIGNAFTNTSGGLMIKYGNFEDPSRSSFYNARTGKGTGRQLKRNAEVFIYFNPQLVHQFYNATVEGPLFRKDKGPFVSEITKSFYQHRWGIHYAERGWTLDVHFVLKNREAVSMREKERYGSISIAYRFGRTN